MVTKMTMACARCETRRLEAVAAGRHGFIICDECYKRRRLDAEAAMPDKVISISREQIAERVRQIQDAVEEIVNRPIICEACETRAADPDRRKVVYIAHPLRGTDPDDTVRNRKRASLLVAQIASERNIAPVASWIILSEHWSEETGRELGLIIDKALIEVCEELWIIGPVRPLSAGMQIEVAHAKKHGVFVVNLQGVYE